MTGQVTLSELMAAAGSRQTDKARDVAADRPFDDVLADAVHEHARFVFKVAYSVLRNREDAEDAVQETFLRAMRHAREFSKVENRRAWLARTAWRIAIDHTRKMKHVSLDGEANEALRAVLDAMQANGGAGDASGSPPSLTGQGAAPSSLVGAGAENVGGSAEAALINDQMLGLLRSFITALPGDLRDVVTLSTVNEMTSAEMAAVLGILETSVRTRLFRARQLLKEKFTAVMERKTVGK